MTVLLAALLAVADAPKPNTLAPREAAEGWLLLFDGETTFGWQIEGDAKVADGALILGGDKPVKAKLSTPFAGAEYGFEYTDLQGHGEAKVSIGGDLVHGAHPIRPPAAGQNAGWHLASGAVLGGDLAIRTAVRIELPAGARVSLRNFKLKPAEQKPLFNGKDLAGWKKYTGDEKRSKTDFSVTPEGWLHLKNGPGDLQTEKLYDNFLLQVECKTNGNRLNSGVFFRCIPGEYQNGYEAQIHNGFDAEHPKEYTIDEYDPKTNELKEKKKVKYTAMDYGTGAVYRRIPARRQAARDNEWFTMTVVADGRHIATWVNGVQVVDWTDNRPTSANPRNGCRLEKGAISLQGHDPTTDIDFRALRISELPSAEK
jgi:hypothetical protein